MQILRMNELTKGWANNMPRVDTYHKIVYIDECMTMELDRSNTPIAYALTALKPSFTFSLYFLHTL